MIKTKEKFKKVRESINLIFSNPEKTEYEISYCKDSNSYQASNGVFVIELKEKSIAPKAYGIQSYSVLTLKIIKDGTKLYEIEASPSSLEGLKLQFLLFKVKRSIKKILKIQHNEIDSSLARNLLLSKSLSKY